MHWYAQLFYSVARSATKLKKYNYASEIPMWTADANKSDTNEVCLCVEK